jgi:hypothetical protein
LRNKQKKGERDGNPEKILSESSRALIWCKERPSKSGKSEYRNAEKREL